jgi:hypothetical protein
MLYMVWFQLEWAQDDIPIPVKFRSFSMIVVQDDRQTAMMLMFIMPPMLVNLD